VVAFSQIPSWRAALEDAFDGGNGSAQQPGGGSLSPPGPSGTSSSDAGGQIDDGSSGDSSSSDVESNDGSGASSSTDPPPGPGLSFPPSSPSAPLDPELPDTPNIPDEDFDMVCIGDRSITMPQVYLAQGWACARMVANGVRCDSDYTTYLQADCPSSRDKADWIFSLHYKLTGECVTAPHASRLVPRIALPTFYGSVRQECLERRGPAVTCIGDRSSSLPATIVAQAYACARMAPYGVQCDEDYQTLAARCPTDRDGADWTFSLHHLLTGTCDVQPAVSILVSSASLATDHPSVKDTCIEVRPD